jgi:thioredoxin 1
VLKITDSFEEINANPNAVVYFTAEWCGPCKQLKPQYGKASVMDADTDYFMVDVDKISSKLLEKYNIKSIPQIFIMNNGEIVRSIKSKIADDIIKEVYQEN